jgi:hypothetical protein
VDVVSPSIPCHRMTHAHHTHHTHHTAERVQGCGGRRLLPPAHTPCAPTHAHATPLALTPHREQALAHVWVRVWKAATRRPKAAARLDLEVSAGWAIPSSRGLWGGDALLL